MEDRLYELISTELETLRIAVGDFERFPNTHFALEVYEHFTRVRMIKYIWLCIIGNESERISKDLYDMKTSITKALKLLYDCVD